MKLHEYQTKQLFKAHNIPVPNGFAVSQAAEVREGLKKLSGDVFVVKAQIHAGGRGKGGGVKLGKTPDEVERLTQQILGMTLVTHQTGPEGKLVRKVYIEEGSAIAKEYYLGITLDRGTGKIALMASQEGGVEIETVAEKTPEKIFVELADPLVGLQPFQARKLAYKLELPAEAIGQAVSMIQSLYSFYVSNDCSMVEINPLVLTKDNKLIALDGKVDIDNNALFRHKDLLEFRDIHEEDPKEYEASKFNLSYINLDGSIGCMVNGAGLAMATMDIVKYYGGSPANFLDVGGGANANQVKEAFRIIVSDSRVKGILVNIFGGIMKCDTIATGIIEATKSLQLTVPLVVRLQGTNVAEGKKLLSGSGLAIHTADTMSEAAEKIVALVNKK